MFRILRSLQLRSLQLKIKNRNPALKIAIRTVSAKLVAIAHASSVILVWLVRIIARMLAVTKASALMGDVFASRDGVETIVLNSSVAAAMATALYLTPVCASLAGWEISAKPKCRAQIQLVAAMDSVWEVSNASAVVDGRV
jgi:hypothetical protein